MGVWGLIPPRHTQSPQKKRGVMGGGGTKRMTYEDTTLERDVSTL